MEELPDSWFLRREEQCCHIIVLAILTKIRFGVIPISTALQRKPSINPLSPNSDENQISLYIITTCSNIQVKRIKEVITKDKLSSVDN